MAEKKRGLGRGLSALMADVNNDAPASAADSSSRRPEQHLPIENVAPNPDQPRRNFDGDKLRDLAESIREKGIIQPLIVRPDPADTDRFQIVAGERRWRAAQIAQLHEVPVIIREFDDTEVLEVAIIENIQRADLNPVEEAAGYRQLIERFGHTQDQLAKALGKSRSHIANQMRLLSLPQDVIDFLEKDRLSAGHARALITSDDPSALARVVVAKGLSVRETEKLVKKGAAPKTQKSGARQPAEKDADTVALEGDLSANLGMKVTVNHDTGQESGQVTIRYTSLDDLDELCRKLTL
ncbi:ParB/RepB/Spo0J family partition protein [Aquicoccus porphyridii]|uniref:ParB/RepB/Spo0J family partition protein n=1 Tax=Aquicoccus porphyridii TaxID=1852029 RepID=A0A5A9Z837_9RHOB|nr:ParB/RepB/Spo0J family partition protein [Aquicoccus porphyridii]KAA0913331.1 ParB/RepB/Spo0J family partition protein [Aquicoccus porphyridii]RAI52248.1 chromosome partitioning protein ParB [Rhodobacteraceae bacterium AsT-22]